MRLPRRRRLVVVEGDGGDLGPLRRLGLARVRGREHEEADTDHDDAKREADPRLGGERVELLEVDAPRDDGEEDEVDLEEGDDEDGVVEPEGRVHAVEPDAHEADPADQGHHRPQRLEKH